MINFILRLYLYTLLLLLPLLVHTDIHNMIPFSSFKRVLAVVCYVGAFTLLQPMKPTLSASSGTD